VEHGVCMGELRYTRTCKIQLDNPKRKAHFGTTGVDERILGGDMQKLW
jgi:hypothetical protein